MITQADCPYCEKQHLNFGDVEEEVDMWIEKTRNGKHVIAVDYSVASSAYALSAPINYCPFCGRKLKEVKVDAD